MEASSEREDRRSRYISLGIKWTMAVGDSKRYRQRGHPGLHLLVKLHRVFKLIALKAEKNCKRFRLLTFGHLQFQFFSIFNSLSLLRKTDFFRRIAKSLWRDGNYISARNHFMYSDDPEVGFLCALFP